MDPGSTPGQGRSPASAGGRAREKTLDSITNLLRALAEAIRPYLGLDSIGAGDAGDIEGLDELVDESVGNYIENEGVLTSSSFDPSDFDIVVSDDFGNLLGDYDVLREGEFDPARYDLLDESDISYLIDSKVSEEVEAWVEDNLEEAIESAMGDALVVQPAGLYTSDEFLAAVEAAVRATLTGITFTVQANVPQPEVHLDGHSSDEVVVAGV